ncbi:hypothetical protein TSOC_010390 [Tetrabaena socialis]|uniref:ditrans,polycis-polyprenyl diphosphate synthase [(2E,6E)-farnesyldiphosphate specific] n=1 Tax=Tetrabaena socialis TaxID=47790 RepID=A0A2J7ZTG3_9CHLO|nr:hypothetical protein TSOC_010390 [Tetrabaena socialis]|eukprot:PNH03563.1 hypothetical protein TSOC_010390 [Tetrabaena socialis]
MIPRVSRALALKGALIDLLLGGTAALLPASSSAARAGPGWPPCAADAHRLAPAAAAEVSGAAAEGIRAAVKSCNQGGGTAARAANHVTPGVPAAGRAVQPVAWGAGEPGEAGAPGAPPPAPPAPQQEGGGRRQQPQEGVRRAAPDPCAAGRAGGQAASAAPCGGGGGGVVRVLVLSAEDGYDPVLQAARTGGICAACGALLPLQAAAYREGLARLREQMAALAGPAVLVQPELVLVVGPVLSLAGYPPFQVAASEILHLGRGRCLERAGVELAVAKYMRTEQRFGK